VRRPSSKRLLDASISVRGPNHRLSGLSGRFVNFAFVSFSYSHYTVDPMTIPSQPNIKLVNSPEYRESYANSVQVRVNVWDFFLVFGTLQQQTENQVEVLNFQGIYLSPQQAKALTSILQQNVASYESTFGEIKLDPRMTATGPVH
jgi:flagellar protein FlaG